MRLNKFLASAGIASRRRSDDLIRQGRVLVNGIIADALGCKINPDSDEVIVDGQQITQPDSFVYCLFNKPRGCLTSVTDPFERPTVMDYLTDLPERVFPIGRLDMDSEGLLVFTNDGALGYALTHPSHEIEKEYDVLVNGCPTPGAIKQMETGVPMYGRKTAGACIKERGRAAGGTRLTIIIHEGKKRQIRNMCAFVGYPVIRLKRVRVGPIELGDLKESTWRYLSSQEVATLKRAAGIPPSQNL